MAARKKAAPRRAGGKKSSSPLLVIVLVLSLAGLGASLWLLREEKRKNADQSTLTEKAMKMAEAHPDAEVFQVDEEPAPQKKK